MTPRTEVDNERSINRVPHNTVVLTRITDSHHRLLWPLHQPLGDRGIPEINVQIDI